MLTRVLKKIGLILACVGSYLGLEQLIDLQTKGFCLQKIIASDLPYNPRWETSPLPDDNMQEIKAILKQPFHLIGSGSECFAFMSEDGKTVIKFFKLSFARPIYYHRGLFSEDHSSYAGTLSNHPLTQQRWKAPFDQYRQRFLGIREFRLNRTFSSCKQAYDKLQEETGVFYLHLNPTDCFNSNLTLVDRNGIAYKVPADSSKFILQHRATPLEEHFRQLISEGKVREAQESIDSLFNLVISRCKKGFFDRDFINRNLGYIGNRAIEIDLGSFIPDPAMASPMAYKKEVYFATLELRGWLEKNGADLLPYFDQQLERAIYE